MNVPTTTTAPSFESSPSNSSFSPDGRKEMEEDLLRKRTSSVTYTAAAATTAPENSTGNTTASTGEEEEGGSRNPYRGVRMRKWGTWVAEIREPRKKSRIWLGSYASPVAAARAFDTANLYLRGSSARLNFPRLAAAPPPPANSDPDGLEGSSSSSVEDIRKKAIEVGMKVDAFEASLQALRERLFQKFKRENLGVPATSGISTHCSSSSSSGRGAEEEKDL